MNLSGSVKRPNKDYFTFLKNETNKRKHHIFYFDTNAMSTIQLLLESNTHE